MRQIQNILLVVGAASLGVVSCGLGLALFGIFTIFATRPGEDPSLNWGAAFGFMMFGGCGGVFGGIAGMVGAIRWINQGQTQAWGLTTWIGIITGNLVAFAIRISGVLNGNIIDSLISWWPAMALLVAATATLGGFIGAFAGNAIHRARPRRKKKKRKAPRRED